MRAYNETITWLRFRTELRSAPPSFWLLIGECVAGVRQLTGIALPAVEGRFLERELRATAMQARLALDGLTIPLDQIRNQLAPPPGTPVRGRWRVEVAALERVLSDRSITTVEPTVLRSIHRTLTEEAEEELRPGQWRLAATGLRPHEGVPPEVVGLFSEELCDWLYSADLAAPASDEEAAYALIRMLLAELYLYWIRPFEGAHFRTAAGVATTILHAIGQPATAAHLASIAFYRHAREFQRQVQQASEGPADPIPFLAFALRAMNEVLQELHATVHEAQVRGQWRAQLLDLFQAGNDEPTRRQRQILLDLSKETAAVPLSQLDTHSPVLAKLYAGVSEKTLRRDVDAMLAAGVLHKSPDGLTLDMSNVLAFRH